jgi:hypothetical protein
MLVRSILLTLILLTSIVPLWSQESATGEEAVWKPLFNGKDLTGWRIHGEEDWHVENKMIVGQSTTGKYGYLATEGTYRDFALRVKFRCEAKGNSGVFFHSTLEGTDIKGIQAEVDPNGNTAGLYESGGRGWLVKPDSSLQKQFRQDEWNQMEITCIGNRITTRFNGEAGVEFIDPEPRFKEGVIALQIHSGGGVRVVWKDLLIRDRGGVRESR